MHGVELFFALAQQVYFGVVAFWPITLTLTAVWICAVFLTKRAPGWNRWRTFALDCLPPFAFPVAILICGVVFAAPPSGVVSEARAIVGQAILVALLLTQLPLAAVASWQSGERWSRVGASWAFGGYLSLLAGFISGMAITGVWL